MLGWLLVILLVLLLLGALPIWPNNQRRGYGSSGFIGFLLLLALIGLMVGWF